MKIQGREIDLSEVESVVFQNDCFGVDILIGVHSKPKMRVFLKSGDWFYIREEEAKRIIEEKRKEFKK